MLFESEQSGKTGALTGVIEPFVDADRAADFLGITRRRMLEMARAGEIPGHPIGGGKRKTWRFRLSEVAEAVAVEKPSAFTAKRGIIDSGSPRQPNRRN
jgi:excisionase family DNA binding protein